jgi:hypothetical protein
MSQVSAGQHALFDLRQRVAEISFVFDAIDSAYPPSHLGPDMERVDQKQCAER